MTTTHSHARTDRQGVPCVFFDRDGIVNRSPGPGYVERVEDFHILDDFVHALRIVAARGYRAVIITNQRGVGTGRMTQRALDDIHDVLHERLAREKLAVLDIFACTEPDREHPRRKPRPTMILEAAAKHGLDLARSWMIGDSESDVDAGRAAGCRTVRVAPLDKTTDADAHLPDMAALPGFLERHLKNA